MCPCHEHNIINLSSLYQILLLELCTIELYNFGHRNKVRVANSDLREAIKAHAKGKEGRDVSFCQGAP